MKNNKGFTLVELLAVLTIVVIILLIALPSIYSSVERNRSKSDAQMWKIVEDAAVIYVDLYKGKFDYTKFKNGNCVISTYKLYEMNLTEKTIELSDGKTADLSNYCFRKDFKITNTCTKAAC